MPESENHKILRNPYQNQENHENLFIPRQIYENHKIHITTRLNHKKLLKFKYYIP